MEIRPAYQGEALLLRWGENYKGRTITLQLDEHFGNQHPFKGLKCGENGQRMQVVCVLIDENEEPQQPPAARTVVKAEEPAEGVAKKRFLDMPRSQQAALKCGDIPFQQWIDTLQHTQERQHFLTDDGYADAILKELLGITSKKELDKNPVKASEWDRMLCTFDFKDRA